MLVDLTPSDLHFLLNHARHRVERLRKSVKNLNSPTWTKASPKYRAWALDRLAEHEATLPEAEALVTKLGG